MGQCEECGVLFDISGHRFCSRPCRAKFNGRQGWGKTNQGHAKVCEECGQEFHIPRNRLETARACSRACLGKLQSRERKGTGWQTGSTNPTWKGGIQTYRRYRKDACERCGATEKLCVHHKDENRYNNGLANLETLCRRCHQVHHNCTKNLPRGPRGPRVRFPQPCAYCGEMFVRINTNQKCCSRRCAQRRRYDVPITA